MAIAGQVAQAIENAKLYDHAQRRVAELEALARISEAVSESLYLEESLEEIVETTMSAVNATGAAIVLEDGRIAWPGGSRRTHALRAPAPLEGTADRRARLRPRHALHRRGTDAARRRSPTMRRSRSSTAARSCAAFSLRRSTTASRTTSRRSPRCSGCRRARPDVDPRRALEDSVNRILAIAAVHEVLTERREDDVDLGELIERLRRMIVQGLGAGKHVESRVEPVSLAGERATALALVFAELLQNALEHGGDQVVDRALAAERRASLLAVADNGAGVGGAKHGHRALDRPGARSRRARGHARRSAATRGLRAEVAFPA